MRKTKGTFDIKNKLPKTNSNVTLISGWVQDTVEKFLKEKQPKINFIHMDLDTYDRYCGYHSHFTSIDIQDAIKKLKLLIFDKDLRHKLGSNAKKHAFDKFSWSSVLKSYSQLKDDLIKIRTTLI